MNVTHSILVKSSWPGPIGGAILRGQIVGTRIRITVKASKKVVIRAPLPGEFWTVSGYLINHPDYGKQLIASKCEISRLPRTCDIGSLLCNHPSFRGFHFGKAKARKLLEQIGPDSLVDCLNHGNISALSDVLNSAIAQKLVAQWATLENETDTYNFLREHNFDAALSRKTIKLTKNNTVERLKKNPYALVCFGGVTKNIWRTLESVARKMDIPKCDSRRLVASVEHVLYERLRQGHTAVTSDILELEVEGVLKCKKLTQIAIPAALRTKAICITSTDDGHLIQPIGPAYIEHSIEKRLDRLLTGEMQKSLFCSDSSHMSFILDRYSKEFSLAYRFSLSEQQRSAIALALTERCSIISGFGGTGKTTALRAVVDIATSMNRQCYLMALSGNAKVRISQATNHSALTIHAFIKAVQEKSENIDIHCDPLIIIDEASMVDAVLFNKLLALFDGLSFSLLTVGDTAQLSPVGFGVVWHKLVKSDRIKKVHLTEVHRQVANSPIHCEAMRLRNDIRQLLPKWKNQNEGIFLHQSRTEELIHSITQLKRTYPDAQILTPHLSERKSDSAHRINASLQELLNPLSSSTKGLSIGYFQIHEGDPVIVTENNYELELFNGMTGKLLRASTNNIGQPCGLFQFDNCDDRIELSVDQLFDVGVQLAYAITVHKSQGSEYDQAIICCATLSPLVERSLLYTAVTRAKKLCIVVGSQQIYDHAASQQSRAESLSVGFNL